MKFIHHREFQILWINKSSIFGLLLSKTEEFQLFVTPTRTTKYDMEDTTRLYWSTLWCYLSRTFNHLFLFLPDKLCISYFTKWLSIYRINYIQRKKDFTTQSGGYDVERFRKYIINYSPIFRSFINSKNLRHYTLCSMVQMTLHPAASIHYDFLVDSEVEKWIAHFLFSKDIVFFFFHNIHGTRAFYYHAHWLTLRGKPFYFLRTTSLARRLSSTVLFTITTTNTNYHVVVLRL